MKRCRVRTTLFFASVFSYSLFQLLSLDSKLVKIPLCSELLVSDNFNLTYFQLKISSYYQIQSIDAFQRVKELSLAYRASYETTLESESEITIIEWKGKLRWNTENFRFSKFIILIVKDNVNLPCAKDFAFDFINDFREWDIVYPTILSLDGIRHDLEFIFDAPVFLLKKIDEAYHLTFNKIHQLQHPNSCSNVLFTF